MRSSALALVIVSLSTTFTAKAAELDPLAVPNVEPAPPGPEEVEAGRKCEAARQAAHAAARPATPGEAEECRSGPLGRMRSEWVGCAEVTPRVTEPACDTSASLFATRTQAARALYEKAVRARDDCIKADPLAFAGYVNLRNRALVTAEQMTAVRRCVERASQSRR
jgi:hypothetical protein